MTTESKSNDFAGVQRNQNRCFERQARNKVWNVSSGATIATFSGFGRIEFPFCWSSDGSKIASGGYVHVWDVDSGELISKTEDVYAEAIAWRPDHQQLACAINGSIVLLDAENLNQIREFRGHTASVFSIDWDKHGTSMVSSGRDCTVRFWDVEVPDPNLLLLSEGAPGSADWNFDGSLLAAGSGQCVDQFVGWQCLRSSPREFSQSESDLEGTYDEVPRAEAVAFHPSANKLAFGGRMNRVMVLDVDTDQIQTMQGEVKETKSFAWSRDGRLAAISFREPEINSGIKTATELPTSVSTCRN